MRIYDSKTRFVPATIAALLFFRRSPTFTSLGATTTVVITGFPAYGKADKPLAGRVRCQPVWRHGPGGERVAVDG